jgi:hypothetical protein
VAGSYEHGNEPSGSAKAGKFLDELSDCQLFKDSAPWSLLLLLLLLRSEPKIHRLPASYFNNFISLHRFVNFPPL